MLYNLLLEGETAAGNTGGNAGGSNVGQIIMLGVILVLFVGFMIWSSISNKKKQKEAQEKINQLKIGDRVKTIGGICGFVAEINDAENTFVLKTGMDGKESYVKFDKAAIYQTAPAEGAVVAEKATEAKVEEAPVEEVKKEEPVKEEAAPKQAPKKKTAKKNTEEEAK